MPQQPERIPGVTIKGLAIVSTDGMIADRAGIQPDSLKLEADQQFFFSVLDAADVLVHGRNSGEGGPNAARRSRIVLTRRIEGVARDPENAKTVLWNPAGARLAEALGLLETVVSRVAVIGGTEVFGLFLDSGYDIFHLSRTAAAHLPGGRPVFPGVPAHSPEDLMTRHGLKPGLTRVLDPSVGLTLTTWTPSRTP